MLHREEALAAALLHLVILQATLLLVVARLLTPASKCRHAMLIASSFSPPSLRTVWRCDAPLQRCGLIARWFSASRRRGSERLGAATRL